MKARGRAPTRAPGGGPKELPGRTQSILERKARRRLCSYCGKKERERQGKKLVEVQVPAPEGEDRGKFLIHEACRDEIDRRAEESLQERTRKEDIETSVMFAAAQVKAKDQEDRRDPFEEKGGIIVPKVGRNVEVPKLEPKKEDES